MDGLKAAADKRKREQTINYEKIAAKQMQREGKEFESKGRFLTEGYKNMLMLNKDFEEDDDAKEKYNENNSAANRSDMTNFFRKMYAQEMTFGGPRGAIEKEGHKENIQIEFNAAASDSEDDNKTSEKGSKAMGVQQPGTDEVKSKERAEIKRERSRSQSKDRPRVKESKTVDQTEMEALKQKEPVLSREQKIELLKQRMMERKQNPTSILPE